METTRAQEAALATLDRLINGVKLRQHGDTIEELYTEIIEVFVRNGMEGPFRDVANKVYDVLMRTGHPREAEDFARKYNL